MPATIESIRPQQLKLYTTQEPTCKTPNQWFVSRYEDQFAQYGSPFMEIVEPVDGLLFNIIPATINLDFMASILGNCRELGHHTIFFDPEMQFYFKDSDGIYKPTTPQKLENLYRGLMMKCAQHMPANVNKFNLVQEFRGDRISKAVINRARSILAADSSFFSPSSPNRRIRGQELHERVARRFVDEMLCGEPGKVLLLADAFAQFLRLLKEQGLEPVKRSDFKALVTPMIRDQFNVCLRNDLKIDERQGVRGWKNVGYLNQTVPE